MSDRDENDVMPADREPTEEELAQARALGDALDGLLAGELPADAAGDELVGTARMIRASTASAGTEEHLSGERRQELVQQAMARTARTAAARRPRARRVAPYLALAASVVLLVSALLLTMAGPTRDEAGPPPPRTDLLSRPSNDLMGRPFEDRAGASQRLDLVFADRLSGYRQVKLLAARGTP